MNDLQEILEDRLCVVGSLLVLSGKIGMRRESDKKS
jgi:hypothetical protein